MPKTKNKELDQAGQALRTADRKWDRIDGDGFIQNSDALRDEMIRESERLSQLLSTEKTEVGPEDVLSWLYMASLQSLNS